MSYKNLPRIEVAIPAYGTQCPQWWSAVMAMCLKGNGESYVITRVTASTTMMPDTNRNSLVESKKQKIPDKYHNLTDANRNLLSVGFLDTDADYLMFIDDDTAPPPDALVRLLSLRREWVSGLYFLPSKPYHPIAYFRHADGYYQYYTAYTKGTLLQVDAVGLGCSLIHRSVFEKIKEQHAVFLKPNGSLLCVHKRQIKNRTFKKIFVEPFIKDGEYRVPVMPVPEDDPRPFPFFQLEASRTEDMYFSELASNVGIRPWLDTTVVCDHIKSQPTTITEYERGLLIEAEKEGNEVQKL